jgi:hypothetical protein
VADGIVLLLADRKLGQRAKREPTLPLPDLNEQARMVWQVVTDPDLFHVAVGLDTGQFAQGIPVIHVVCGTARRMDHDVVRGIMWVKEADGS